MEHYDAATWSDYVRGTLADAEARLMGRHLEAGCERCAGHARLLGMVERTAADDRAVEVPAGAVRSVKAMFRQRKLVETETRTAPALQLVFDSSSAPATAGVRSGERRPRHLMYMSAELSLDLQLIPNGSDRLQVVGEIVGREAGQVADVPVSLVAGERVLAEDTTGSSGDFDLEGAVSAKLKLRFELPDTSGIELDLPLRAPNARSAV